MNDCDKDVDEEAKFTLQLFSAQLHTVALAPPPDKITWTLIIKKMKISD